MTPSVPRPTTVVQRERRKRRYFGALATLGVLILLVELSLNWLFKDPIEWMPVLIGMVIGFAGFAGLDFKKANAAADAIVDWGERIIIVLRTGRRATDTTAISVTAICPTCHKAMTFCNCPDEQEANDAPG